MDFRRLVCIVHGLVLSFTVACAVVCSIAKNDVVLGTPGKHVDVGAIAGGVVGTFVAIIVFLILYKVSPKFKGYLVDSLALMDTSLTDLDKSTTPYRYHRAHLPQTLMLGLATVLFGVGAFTNSIIVYEAPPWLSLESGASVGIWRVDLDGEFRMVHPGCIPTSNGSNPGNMLVPDVVGSHLSIWSDSTCGSICIV